MAKLTTKERLQKRLLAGDFDSKKGGGGDSYLRLEKGENYIRVLPPKSLDIDADDFYLERKRHFGVGPNNRSETCPKTDPDVEKCIVCNKVAELDDEGDKIGAGRLRAKARFLMNAVKLDSKNKCPAKAQILDAPKTVMKEIAKYYNNEEWGEPWGSDCGKKKVRYDFLISKDGEGLDTTYSVQVTSKFKELANSKELLKSLFDLKEKYPIPTPKEMQNLFLGDDDEDEPVGKKHKKVEEDEDEEIDDDEEEDEDDEEPKSKKSSKSDDDEEDEEKESDDDEDEDEESDDDDDEEEDEDETDEEEDDDSEDDEEDSDDDEEDNDEDEEEEEEDEDEKPVKKSSKKDKKPAKKNKEKKAGKGASLEARMKAALKKGKR
jgi:hypothetical protein